MGVEVGREGRSRIATYINGMHCLDLSPGMVGSGCLDACSPSTVTGSIRDSKEPEVWPQHSAEAQDALDSDSRMRGVGE